MTRHEKKSANYIADLNKSKKIIHKLKSSILVKTLYTLRAAGNFIAC